MQIDEALKTLGELRDITFVWYNPDKKAAVGLGMEALKKLRRIRRSNPGCDYVLLPGETED